jgi:hypothetical protein
MSKNNVVCEARPLTAPAAAGTLHPSRPMQMAPVFTHMAALLRKSRRTATVTSYMDLSGDKPVWVRPDENGNLAPTTYTRKQVLDHLTRMQEAAQPHMDLLTKAGLEAIQASLKATSGKSTYMRMADLLECTRPCKSWTERSTGNVRAAEDRPAFVEALIKIPSELKAQARKAEADNDLTDILAVGEAWYCAGVKDGDNFRPFASKYDAQKKHLHLTYGPDAPEGKWWLHPTFEGMKKKDKMAWADANIPATAVFQQGEAFHATPEAADFGDIDAMHHAEVRRLARENGAGDDVTTGKGAAAKSREYLRGLTQQKRIDHGESVTRAQVGTTVEELSPEMMAALRILASQIQGASE